MKMFLLKCFETKKKAAMKQAFHHQGGGLIMGVLKGALAIFLGSARGLGKTYTLEL